LDWSAHHRQVFGRSSLLVALIGESSQGRKACQKPHRKAPAERLAGRIRSNVEFSEDHELSAPIQRDESQKRDLLCELQLLDSDPAPALDVLARLVASLVDVPIAVVSLVDSTRRWFRAKVGFDAEVTARELAFCMMASQGDQPVIVPDTTADPRFADSPFVTGEPHIRAYAGIRLSSKDGHTLGALCAIDRKPHRFSDSDIQVLQGLAKVVNLELLTLERTVKAESFAEATRQAVEESDRLYHAMVDNAGIGIAVVGLDGQWLRINPKMCEILGRSAEALRQLTFHDITHPEDLNEDLDLVQRLLDGETSTYTLEKRYIRPDGEAVWGNLTVTLVRDDSGFPKHFVSLIEDITQRRAAEEALRKLRQQLEERVVERTDELQRANEVLAEAVVQLRSSEQELEQSRADLRAVLTHAHDAYISIDATGQIVEWNRQAEATFGWTREEAVGRRLDALVVPPAMREKHRRGMKKLALEGASAMLNRRIELPALRRDGKIFPCELSITELQSQTHGKIYAAFLHDISDRKFAERQLAESHRALEQLSREQHLMLDNELVGIVRVKNRTVVWANRALERLFGYEPGELVGKPTRAFYPDEDAYRGVGKEGYATIEDGRTFRIQLELVCKRGAHIWVDMSGAMLAHDSGESLWMMQDITAMKRYQQKVEELAFHDGLTGLPNRQLLNDRLNQALAVMERTGKHAVVCFTDLNDFKAINDTYGHEAGDELLRTVAKRLHDCVRGHDCVGRLGGDEFVLLLTELDSMVDASPIIQRAKDALDVPVRLGPGATVRISASFGTALAPEEGRDAATLLAVADSKMYLDKRHTKRAAKT
jgi:diguanylate cyclase (GGDEF)-like protein/PAS domain S-box-containing protein